MKRRFLKKRLKRIPSQYRISAHAADIITFLLIFATENLLMKIIFPQTVLKPKEKEFIHSMLFPAVLKR